MTRKETVQLLLLAGVIALGLVGCSSRPVVITLPAPTTQTTSSVPTPAERTLSPGAQFIAMMAGEGIPVTNPDQLVGIAQSACQALRSGHSLAEVTTAALNGITDTRVQVQVIDVITGGQVVYCPDTLGAGV